MSTTQPIRSTKELKALREYYGKDRWTDQRNRLLIIMGLNTALRITDILHLQWDMVYDFTTGACRRHLALCEKKTGKETIILLNDMLRAELEDYRRCRMPLPEDFIFESQKGGHIDRYQAYRIIKRAAAALKLPGRISCHSLRKTFGYHAWKKGVPPALLMNIYNHSSFDITRRYLCIEQDDRDDVFAHVQL